MLRINSGSSAASFLTQDDTQAQHWTGFDLAAHTEGVVLRVHERMSSIQPFQVILLAPGLQVLALQGRLTQQPSGLRLRCHISHADRQLVVRKSNEAHAKAALSDAAHEFLTTGAMETKRRHLPGKGTHFNKHFLSLTMFAYSCSHTHTLMLTPSS